MPLILFLFACAAALVLPGSVADASGRPADAPPERARSVRVTVLSTMLAGDPRYKGIGEWGYAALVEADGRKVLFDTGARADTVLQNARELRVDLSDVTDVVISHNHWDHVGGLLTLRRELAKTNPDALSRVFVAKAIFNSRPSANAQERNGLLPLKEAYEATGGVFIEHSDPAEILPGVWFTGPIPRVHPEYNYERDGRMQTAAGVLEDNIPEDAALVINTVNGLIVLSGCGHAGIVNTVDYGRKIVREARVDAVIGGLHLFGADDQTIAWTAGKLRDARVRHVLAGHCTGLEATYQLRKLLGLDRSSVVVSAVGATFTSAKGIDPLLLAR